MKKRKNITYGCTGIITVCKGCTERYEACHDHCERYQEQYRQKEEKRKEMRIHIEATQYVRESIDRVLKYKHQHRLK